MFYLEFKKKIYKINRSRSGSLGCTGVFTHFFILTFSPNFFPKYKFNVASNNNNVTEVHKTIF